MAGAQFPAAAAALVTFTVLPSKRELAQRQNQSQPVTSAPAATAPDAINNPAAHQ